MKYFWIVLVLFFLITSNAIFAANSVIKKGSTMAESFVLLTDPKVLAIPIHENSEPLIDLKDHPEILFGPSPEIENNVQYTKLRSAVYKKLLEAQNHLPSGLRFCVYEGLKTISLQKQIFETRRNIFKDLHKEWSDHDIYQEVIKWVSPVTDINGKANIPPHSTGGAIDIYLVDSKTHLPVEMGILVKDWMQDTDGALSMTRSPIISAEAKKNRAILFQVMTAVGFINYPTEYWHWSYGDRYWAFSTGNSYAFYGPTS